MAIEYRPWRDGDDLALLEIWGDPDTGEAGQFRGALALSSNGRDGTPWRRCIVAEDVIDGVAIPVAAGVVYEAPLHLHRGGPRPPPRRHWGQPPDHAAPRGRGCAVGGHQVARQGGTRHGRR